MSIEAQELGRLFELSWDAVIGVRDEIVAFANPSAEALLALREGDRADSRIPAHILSDEARRFVTSFKLDNRQFDASVVRTGDFALISCMPREDAAMSPPPWERALRELGSDLMNTRLALDGAIRLTNADMDPRLSEYAAVLYRSYYRMKRLQDHLTLSGELLNHALPFSPRTILIDELCEKLCDTVDNVIREMDIRIIFEAAVRPCSFTCDPALMETMLLNLLSNSLEHADGGDAIRVSLNVLGKRMVLAVDDPGKGIPAQRLSGLLGQGAQGGLVDTAEGAGLGLVIIRGIAERHGGALIVESREDKGTCMRVSLPLTQNPGGYTLHQPVAHYRTDGMNAVLTELSNILDKSFYRPKYFD